MKAHPGDAKFVNQNASGQLGALLLEKLTDTQVLIIPYRGAGPAMTDLMSGQVDLAVLQAAVAMPQVRAGTIKALANLSPMRSASMPDIPTSDEAGVPGYYMSGWFGLYAPKGTPPRSSPQAQHRDDAGAGRSGRAPALCRTRPRYRGARTADAGRSRAFQKAEMDKWWPIIKDSGIRGE